MSGRSFHGHGQHELASTSVPFWFYNRRRTEDWLFYYDDLRQQAYTCGLPNADLNSVRNTAGEYALPLSGWLLKVLEDPAARLSNLVLTEALAHLKAHHPALYSRLWAPYLAEGATPGLVAVWEHVAEARQQYLPLREHELALDALTTYVQGRLPHFARWDAYEQPQPMLALRVLVPTRYRRAKRNDKRKRRDDATDTFYHYLQDYGRAEAIRRTAAWTGYSTREVRALAAADEQYAIRRAELTK